MDISIVADQLVEQSKFSIHTSIENDAAANGLSPTLRANLEPALAIYEKSSKDLLHVMKLLANGGSMEGSRFIVIADMMHDGVADLGGKVLEELEVLLKIRLSNLYTNLCVILGSCIFISLLSLAASSS